jgi:putative membrane protein
MLSNLIYSVIGNAVALVVAAYLVSGFNLDFNNLQAGLALVAVFTVLNVILKPILRFFLGPLVILTFGLFNLVITGTILYVVDIYSQNLTITGLPALLYGTLIITAINVLLHMARREKS